MKLKFVLWAPRIGLFVSILLLFACGGESSTPALPLASTSNIAAVANQPGVTPFISFVRLAGSSLGRLAVVGYVIQPKQGSVSKPVTVSYTMEALSRRGYTVAGDVLTLPVFGLYAGYNNSVVVNLQFQDGSVQTLSVAVNAAAYSDPNGIFDRPQILKQRSAGSTLGFDFFALKSLISSPVVVDTDGEIRWVGPGNLNNLASTFVDNGFVIGEFASPKISRLELDGSIAETALISNIFTGFHHNLDIGKHGLLGEMNVADVNATNIEATLADFTRSGAVVAAWDLSLILAAHMRSQGDDPSAFIRAGADWFHMNAATYDPRDDSVIISSRENFVIKLDYTSGAVKWILGDPTKYWYTFPSLRAKALSLQAGGLYPIGQHAVSITSDGLLMLFNNGLRSINQPAGAPLGESRSYSAVSAYAIDAAAGTAQEVWRFDYGQTILSPICSSVYEASGKSLLIDYANTANTTSARLVGVNANHDVVFDFRYALTGSCASGWNAIPVPFEGMRFQ